MTDTMLDTITVTLQRDVEGQFLNIPLEFELVSDVVLLIQDGNRLVIESIKASSDEASSNKPI
jgi:virulence-associated protein VagC